MSSELELLRQRISELEAEKMELRRELEKTIADSSIEISKLNAIIIELKKNKAVINKLKSENIELRDRVTKVEQRQLQNDNVTKVTNSSNNSSSNFNSTTEQLPMEVHSEKSLEDMLQVTRDKEIDDCLLQQTPILEVSPANVPDSVIAQCKLNWETDDTNSKASEERETDAFLGEMYKKSVSNDIRQRNREKKLLRESAIQDSSSVIKDKKSQSYKKREAENIVQDVCI